MFEVICMPNMAVLWFRSRIQMTQEKNIKYPSFWMTSYEEQHGPTMNDIMDDISGQSPLTHCRLNKLPHTIY